MKFKTKPFDHQLTAFERFKDSRFYALLADRGVGKSKITIDIAAYKFTNGVIDCMLVVAPNIVHTQWIDEQLPEHCPVPFRGFAFHLGNKTKKHLTELRSFLLDRKPQLRVLAISVEAFQYPKTKEIVEAFFATTTLPPKVVVDEASRIKNQTALQTKAIKAVARAEGLTFNAIITGTPAAKQPVDTYSMFDFLQQGYMGCTLTAFKHRHCVLKSGMNHKSGRRYEDVIDLRTWNDCKTMLENNRDVNGVIPFQALQTASRRFGISPRDADYMSTCEDFSRFKQIDYLVKFIAKDTYSILKKDCLDLPEKIHEKVVFQLSDAQKKILKTLKKDAIATYGNEILTVEHAATLRIRILQVCGGHFPHIDTSVGVNAYATTPIGGPNRKLDFLQKDIPEIGEQQFLLWAVFVPELDMLYEKLSKNFNVARYDSDKHPEETIRAFKAGEIQGLIAHPSSVGYGFNFGDASIQYWYSRDDRTEARIQAEDRSHRATTTKSPTYIDLLYDCPTEHKVLKNLKEGEELNDLFMQVKDF